MKVIWIVKYILNRRISEETLSKVSVIWITHTTVVILIIRSYPIISIQIICDIDSTQS